MSADQPDAQSSQPASPAANAVPAARVAAATTGPGLAVLFGVLGGAAAWMILFVWYPVFQVPPDVLHRGMGINATAEDAAALAAARTTASRRNAAFALALVGGLVGGSVGIAAGVSRTSVKVVVLGGVACALLGGLFGSAGGLLGDSAAPWLRPPSESFSSYSLFGTMAVQSIVLAAVGVGVGLGIGAATRRAAEIPGSLLAGLLAGIFSATVFTLVGSVIGMMLPEVQTEVTVPADHLSRAIWIGLTAVCLGAIVSSARGKVRETVPPRESAAAT